MLRRAIVPGLIGFLFLVVWGLLVNGVLGFNARMKMRQMPEERTVYEVLKEHVTEPGRYVCNPELDASRMFPPREPVFSVLYGGVGHGAAGKFTLVQLAVFLAVPLSAAWLLLHASDSVLERFPRKLALFVVAGLIIGLLRNLVDFGIGSYPVEDAIFLTAHDVAMWTGLGAVLAWKVKRETTEVSG